jgi:hypothetical protein
LLISGIGKQPPAGRTRDDPEIADVAAALTAPRHQTAT